MYRILVNLPHSLNKNIAQEVSNKLNSLLDAHYELAFPQLHKLNKDLQSALIDDRNYEYIIRIIYHQIAVDYELLKKSLGYPSENFISLFVRMTTKQKCEFIISWVNIFWIFSPIILFFPLKAIYPTHHFSICLGIVILLSIPLCLINKCIKEMKD